jgi:homeodomain-containing protein
MVARWHREGFRGCWSRRSRRRPGRPCIDSQLRVLIRRIATANHPWGAPRIHGELLKLGITVSERTVSRYLPNRLTAPSKTWRTFLANHLGELSFTSTVTSSYTLGDDDVVDGCFAVLPSSVLQRRVVRLKSVGGCRLASFARTARLLAGVSHRITGTTAHAHARALARTRRSRGLSHLTLRRAGGGSFRPETPSGPRPTNGLTTIRSPGAGASSAVLSLSLCNQGRQRRRWAETPSLRPRTARLRVILTAVGMLARHNPTVTLRASTSTLRSSRHG